MKRGPKPKPTNLKILAGVRASRVNDAEPKADPTTPEPPEELDDEARAEWGRFVPQLAKMGILARIDGPALALYCTLHSRRKKALAEVRKLGLVVKTGTGSWKQSPWLQIAREAERDMARMLGEFGCTPSSRSRVRVEGEGEADALAEFVARRRNA